MENRYVPIFLIAAVTAQAFQSERSVAALTPATSIQLDQPWSIAADANGNLFIADTGNHVIRRVTPSGSMTVVAGTGAAGFAGDTGPAADALLNSPMSVAVDSAGHVFIADTANDRIREVLTDGTITTVAPQVKLNNPRSIAIAPAADLIVADTGNDRVLRVSGAGAITTLLEKLHRPASVAVDRYSNVYVADTDAHRILRLSPSGMVQTIAGTGRVGFDGDAGPATAARLNRPAGLAFAGDELLFADMDNHRVRKISASGTISTIASVGSATRVGAAPNAERGEGGRRPTETFDPSSVAADAAGHIWIADLKTNRVRLMVADGFSATVAGLVPTRGFSGDGGLATSARLSEPAGVAVDDRGNLYIADTGNGRIRMVTPDGLIRSIAGAGEPGLVRDDIQATRAQLDKPKSLVVDSNGNLIFIDGGRRVRKFAVDGPITTIADGGGPRALALGPDGSLYIGGAGTAGIRKVSADGTITMVPITLDVDNPSTKQIRLEDLTALAIDRTGGVIFVQGDGRLKRISVDGKLSAVANIIKDGRALLLDDSDSPIIADAAAHALIRIDGRGASAIAGTGVRGIGGDGGPAIASQLDAPSALAFDKAGNIFVADAATDRIRRISVGGIITTVAGGGR